MMKKERRGGGEREREMLCIREDNRRKDQRRIINLRPFGSTRSTGKFEDESFALVIAPIAMRPFPYVHFAPINTWKLNASLSILPQFPLLRQEQR